MDGEAAPLRAGSAAAGGRQFRRLVVAILDLLPVVLGLLAEGAWIAVVYALFQATSKHDLVLGPLEFALGAGLGSIAGTIGPRRLGGRWPLVVVGLVAATGAIGWLGSSAARDTLASGGLGPSLSTHAGGWLMGLAFLRGVSEARNRDDRPSGGSLVAVGIPAIVAAFLFGGALADPARSTFRDAALGDTVFFAATGLVSLSLARIRRLGTRSGLDWRRNPAWLGLLLALVAAILLVAVPASFAVGPAVLLIVTALPVPIFIAGFFVGVDRRGMRLLVVTIALAIAGVIIVRLLLPGQTTVRPIPAGGGGPPPDSTDQGWMIVAGWVILSVVTAIAIAVLAAIWMRQAAAQRDANVGEERTIDRGPDGAERPKRRLPFRRRSLGPPRDAAEAYLATVAALDPVADLRRHTGETPAEHARRIRRAPPLPAAAPSPIPGALSLLAADYELARFGGRQISAPENRRGLARWSAIRAALRSRPRSAVSGAGQFPSAADDPEGGAGAND